MNNLSIVILNNILEKPSASVISQIYIGIRKFVLNRFTFCKLGYDNKQRYKAINKSSGSHKYKFNDKLSLKVFQTK